MINQIQELFQSLKQNIKSFFLQIVMHPKSEELYNSWLQYPLKTRKTVILVTKIVFVFLIVLQMAVGTFKLVTNQYALWKGQDLLETLVKFQIKSGKLKAIQQGFAGGAGIFKETIENLLAPINNKLLIGKPSVHLTPQKNKTKKEVIVKITQINYDKITVRQLVEILYHIQNRGANLGTDNLTMKRIERGWYKVGFLVLKTLPKGSG